MKFLLFLFLTLSFYLSAQENPWEPKKTENPWVLESEKKDSITIADTNAVNVDFQKTEETNDQDLIDNLEDDAKNNYHAGGAFAVGFVSGIVLSYPGALLATVIALPNTKQEKRVVEAVATDSTYITINKELARKKAKSSVKSKKILYSLLGTATGALAQIAIIIALFN